MSAFGTKRRFAAARMFGRFWGEADMPRPPLAYRPIEFDPLLPFAAQRLCVAQLGLLTVFRRARLML
jgi:hypothetical protein